MKSKLIERPLPKSFRTLKVYSRSNIQKNYVFNVIREKVLGVTTQLRMEGVSEVTGLDAACQSLLARELFPANEGFRYFGLDYELKRLKAGIHRRLSSKDTLILFDLTTKTSLPLACFNLVVSSNTLSHIVPALWSRVVSNLIRFVSPCGDLYLNLPNSPELHEVLSQLEQNFLEVSYFYYTSHLSTSAESSVNIQSTAELDQLILDCELALPHRADLFQQVMIYAQFRKSFDYPAQRSASWLRADMVHNAGVVKSINRIEFSDVRELTSYIKYKLTNYCLIVGSDLFFKSKDAAEITALCMQLEKVEFIALTTFSEKILFSSNRMLNEFRYFVFVGTELEYIPDSKSQKLMRESFNFLRTFSVEKDEVSLFSVRLKHRLDGDVLHPTDFSRHG